MRTLSSTALAVALALALSMSVSSCSSTDEDLPREFTQGARIDSDIYDVWAATRSVMRGFSRGAPEFDTESHEAYGVISGEPVTVRLEEHSGGRTVIYINTKKVQVAQDVLSAIQSMLLR